MLVSGSHNNTIKIWGLETGDRIIALKGHSDYSNSLVFSHDGNTLYLYNNFLLPILKCNLQYLIPIKIFKAHTASVWQIIINMSGTLIASCSYDKMIKLWNSSSLEQQA